MMWPVRIDVDGVPQPKGSMVAYPVGRRRRRIVTTSANPHLGAWTHQVRIMALKAIPPAARPLLPIPERAIVYLDFRLRPPRRFRRGWPTGRPDLDKLVRAVLDALTGLAWADDAQVCDITATKRYDATGHPGVAIALDQR
jgi:Holliday junction resolvase RusA-like endonuclease